MYTIVTHSGSFDPDDVLAVAALQLLLGVSNTKIVRSRQQAIIEKGDYVVDVGGVYDAERQRFDHHQNGVPTRENGVPYSAFGLVWQQYGVSVAGSRSVALSIEKRLVEPIDAADNHQTVCHPGPAGVSAFEFFDVIDVLKPVGDSDETFDGQFLVAVAFARELLTRLIAHTQAEEQIQNEIAKVYEAANNKVLLVFEEHVPRHSLVSFPEVQVIVSPVPAPDVSHWLAAVVPVRHRGFQNRALFPESWAGLTDAALADESHILDAIFCHKERYIFVAKTKEAAIKAAHHAII